MNKATEEKLRKVGLEALRSELRRRESVRSRLPSPPVVNVVKELDTPTLIKFMRREQKLIYGVDDRMDLYSVSDELILRDADSVVGLFQAGDVVDNGRGRVTLNVELFGNAMGLCDEEPFRTQPIGPFGSGVLVADSIVATAGHCVNTDSLPSTRFVFGFRMTNEHLPSLDLPISEVYQGTEVIQRVQQDSGPDWALVRLDRPVTNHAVAKLRTDGKIANGQAVHIIGHPCGLPVKYAAGATVRQNDQDAYFVANLDSYGGNSGSPVFNSNTHEVEGILVRGDVDFVQHNNCRVSMVCPATGCRGEDCTRVTEFSSFVKNESVSSAPPPAGLTNITKRAGAPPAAGDPFIYRCESDGRNHVVYRGTDGNLYDIPLDK